ncbi:hypothetical protein SLEP1_g19000 [Rubroshorea leprosula]|nr:hypothetical protein SLEP1_g19000 [Rubroshorea leprosula]
MVLERTILNYIYLLNGYIHRNCTGPLTRASYGRWIARCSILSKNEGGKIRSSLQIISTILLPYCHVIDLNHRSTQGPKELTNLNKWLPNLFRPILLFFSFLPAAATRRKKKEKPAMPWKIGVPGFALFFLPCPPAALACGCDFQSFLSPAEFSFHAAGFSPNCSSGLACWILVLDRPVSLVRELSARFYASELNSVCFVSDMVMLSCCPLVGVLNASTCRHVFL